MADTSVQTKKQKDEIIWWLEILHVLRIIGRIVLKIFAVFFNILLTALLIIFIAGVIAGTAFALYIKNYVDPTIEEAAFAIAGSNTTSSLYYYVYDTMEDRQNRNGKPVEYEQIYAEENSIWASYDQMMQIDENGVEHSYLVDAFVSIEDHRFWSHNGVDWSRTISATIGYFLGTSSYGGSTITQQLVKNITGDDDVKITRKVQEILRALNLAKQKSREEILELYLNIIYLGNNCYGVQSASQYYFNKDVSELTLEECASLAAIVKNPSAYEPEDHDIVYVVEKDDAGNILKDENGNPIYSIKKDEDGNPVYDKNGNPVYEEKGNRKRRRDVLGEMLRFGRINYEDYLEAYDTELTIIGDTGADESSGAEIFSWYTEAVFNSVRDALMEKFGYDAYTASLLIYNGGLQIYTPMDPEVQSTMELVFEDCYNSEYFLQSTKAQQPQYSMVIMDPYTGDVLGLVGRTGEKLANRELNLATEATRPVGSCIKPLSVFAPALEEGLITYGTVYDDTPYTFYVNGETDKLGNDVAPSGWPKNYEKTNLGLTNVNAALRRSCNTIAVKILADYGVEKSFSFLKNTLHIDSLIESYTVAGKTYSDMALSPLGLGQLSFGATNLEMTAAYCIFANDGVYNSPNLWLEVYDSQGNLLLENETVSEVVLSEETADLMTIMMKNVINGGTASTYSLPLQKTVNCAGKTGTTDSDYDRWFMGYTPYYVGGAWVGYEMNMTLGTLGVDAEGFEYAPTLKVWNTVMTMLHQKYIDEAKNGGEKLKTFNYSSNIIQYTVCKDSGKLMSDACYLDPRGSRAEVCYYAKGTEPTEKCDCHTFVYVENAATGGVVPTLESYSGNIASLAQVGLITVDRQFPMEVAVSDAQYVYTPLMSGVMPSFMDTEPFFYNNFAAIKETLYPSVDPPETSPDTGDVGVDGDIMTGVTVIEKGVYGGITGTTNWKTGLISVGVQYNRLATGCANYEYWYSLVQGAGGIIPSDPTDPGGNVPIDTGDPNPNDYED